MRIDIVSNRDEPSDLHPYYVYVITLKGLKIIGLKKYKNKDI